MREQVASLLNSRSSDYGGEAPPPLRMTAVVSSQLSVVGKAKDPSLRS
jgi:hypothetical protein